MIDSTASSKSLAVLFEGCRTTQTSTAIPLISLAPTHRSRSGLYGLVDRGLVAPNTTAPRSSSSSRISVAAGRYMAERISSSIVGVAGEKEWNGVTGVDVTAGTKFGADKWTD